MLGWGRADRDLERLLRDRRAEPSAEFVRAVGDRVQAEKFRPRRGWSRLAFAAAVAVFCLGTFASFGGLSYAASGAVDTYTSVKQVVVKHKLTASVHRSSASDQYGHKPSTPKPAAKPKQTGGVKAATIAPARGTLPFTGISLGTTLGLSLLLIGLGVALRRRERRSE